MSEQPPGLRSPHVIWDELNKKSLEEAGVGLPQEELLEAMRRIYGIVRDEPRKEVPMSEVEDLYILLLSFQRSLDMLGAEANVVSRKMDILYDIAEEIEEKIDRVTSSKKYPELKENSEWFHHLTHDAKDTARTLPVLISYRIELLDQTIEEVRKILKPKETTSAPGAEQ